MKTLRGRGKAVLRKAEGKNHHVTILLTGRLCGGYPACLSTPTGLAFDSSTNSILALDADADKHRWWAPVRIDARKGAVSLLGDGSAVPQNFNVFGSTVLFDVERGVYAVTLTALASEKGLRARAVAEDGANSPAPPSTLFALDVSSGKLRYTADWPAVNVVDWVAHARIPAAPALAVDE